ncbi:MAG: flap endonuclease-1 [Candidatus Asgardarchaeia archaeon]
MGVNLRPLIRVKHKLKFEHLTGKKITIDTNNMLYQFLALIRMPDGRVFTDKRGNVTSHLIGLFYRTTRLITDFGILPIFIFDGPPPDLKKRELEERRLERQKLKKEYIEAISKGDYRTAWSKAVRMDSLSKSMIDDAKQLLRLLGLPVIQAPSEGEAQAAYLVKKGDAWACSTQDYDAFLFGAPRIIRNLTLTGKRFYRSKGIAVPLKPELVFLDELLSELGITYEQLIDIAILIGTDFNDGIKGIGPKKAYELIKKYGCIEKLPKKYLVSLDENYVSVRNFFLSPPISREYEIVFREADYSGVIHFLCEERDFDCNRVKETLKRVQKAIGSGKQTSLSDF